jgi:poly-gamma-glutamate capsule biosynthesis protein CapA/YwtB (metallophosphatase superfamily)
LSVLGVSAIILLMSAAFKQLPVRGVSDVPEATIHVPTVTVRIVAVGDVNLGRQAGQEILKGDTLFPFAAVRDTFMAHDIVFANLECTLSDQKGETQHPNNNLIFTGPPEGAFALKYGGVTIVSTANNHALDYGIGAHTETARYLTEAGIKYVGTQTADLFGPVIVEKRGVRIAFFACTDIMNSSGEWWKRYVAPADSGRLFPRIREIRDSVDFVVLSYHGGDEYADRPAQRTKLFASASVEAGVDLFLGHHPHVPYGIERIAGRYIVHSLGNFVFRQPFHYWTQRSFAFSAEIVKDSVGTRISSFRCLPVVAGLQPKFADDAREADTIAERIRMLSSHTVTELLTWEQ